MSVTIQKIDKKEDSWKWLKCLGNLKLVINFFLFPTVCYFWIINQILIKSVHTLIKPLKWMNVMNIRTSFLVPSRCTGKKNFSYFNKFRYSSTTSSNDIKKKKDYLNYCLLKISKLKAIQWKTNESKIEFSLANEFFFFFCLC